MPISSDEEFNRYTIALQDFEKAQQYISTARTHSPSSLEFEALWFAAIVSYCRPFSRNERSRRPRAKPKLAIKEFGKLSDSQRKVHQQCMQLRNTALAHSEFERNPTRRKKSTNVISSRPFSLWNELSNFDFKSFECNLSKFVNSCHGARADFIHQAC